MDHIGATCAVVCTARAVPVSPQKCSLSAPTLEFLNPNLHFNSSPGDSQAF